MLLGFIVEAIVGMRLDDYLEPGGLWAARLARTTYAQPLRHGFSKDDCAATELNGNTRDGAVSFANVRRETVQGQCHDAKAFHVMGEVSGHAGLFSSASDIAILEQVVLNHGGYGDVRLFDEDTLNRFIKPKDTDPSYGLGWRRKAHDGYTAVFSQVPDTAAIGHTGWTGTFTLIDPANHLGIALLTSRPQHARPRPRQGPERLCGMPLPHRSLRHSPHARLPGTSHVRGGSGTPCSRTSCAPSGLRWRRGGDFDTAPDRADLAALESVARKRGVRL